TCWACRWCARAYPNRRRAARPGWPAWPPASGPDWTNSPASGKPNGASSRPGMPTAAPPAWPAGARQWNTPRAGRAPATRPSARPRLFLAPGGGDLGGAELPVDGDARGMPGVVAHMHDLARHESRQQFAVDVHPEVHMLLAAVRIAIAQAELHRHGVDIAAGLALEVQHLGHGLLAGARQALRQRALVLVRTGRVAHDHGHERHERQPGHGTDHPPSGIAHPCRRPRIRV